MIAAAGEVRQFLRSIGLTSFVKTTGGKGLHLVVPIARRYSWPETKTFAKKSADLLAFVCRAAISPEYPRRSAADASSSIIFATIRHPPRCALIQPARVKAHLLPRRSNGMNCRQNFDPRSSPSRPFRSASRTSVKIRGSAWTGYTNPCPIFQRAKARLGRGLPHPDAVCVPQRCFPSAIRKGFYQDKVSVAPPERGSITYPDIDPGWSVVLLRMDHAR